MNNYLETIDTAINAAYSKRHSNDYYTLYEYERDLQELLSLRSFVEGVLEPAECEHCLGQGENWPVDEESWVCPTCDTEYHSE